MTTTKKYDKKRYQKLKSKGICTGCKTKPARLNKVNCQDCATKNTKNAHKYRKSSRPKR